MALRRIRIPIYSNLTPKAKQRVNLIAGGLAGVLIVAASTGFMGGPEVSTTRPSELPKPKPIGGVPGAQLDAKDSWMGGAGKDLAKMQAEVRELREALSLARGEQQKDREQLRGELQQIGQRVGNVATAAMSGGVQPPQGGGTATEQLFSPPAAGVVPPPNAVPPAPTQPAANLPLAFPGQRAGAAPAGYPPGSPAQLRPGLAPVAAPATAGEGTEFSGGLLRASARSAPDTTAAEPSDLPKQGTAGPAVGDKPAPRRNVASFLPIGFTRARLLGGLAAPTGGQAQQNPVPVILRLVDLGVLPNGFRSQVKDCLVVAEGYGDQSSERAYIRTTLLSCVMANGDVLEVPVMGQLFGEDGMNGIKGRLVTKQDAILANALFAGIASGLGSGIAQATQNVNNTTFGPVTSSPNDSAGILKQAFGTGVGKALDRLSQYLISLAERTFPVIEVQPGRMVDVVIQKGVSLDVALGAVSPRGTNVPTRGGDPDRDRSALMQVLGKPEDE